MIDFEEEIELLEKYLSLEKLRFKHEFDYQIVVNQISEVTIPPMIVQPFIENAIVHGLFHKAGAKRLRVAFSSNEHLVCTIEDNGIGRAAAKQILERKGKNYTSFSGEALARRLKVLGQVFKGNFGYTYEDIVENGQITGTRVTITIPYKTRF